jgi:hypothetical protein
VSEHDHGVTAADQLERAAAEQGCGFGHLRAA